LQHCGRIGELEIGAPDLKQLARQIHFDHRNDVLCMVIINNNLFLLLLTFSNISKAKIIAKAFSSNRPSNIGVEFYSFATN